MRIYLINDIYANDLARLTEHLTQAGQADMLEGLYWFELPAHLLTDEQLAHRDECGPYVMSLECQDDWAQLELLVRAKNKLRCSCVAYATEAQRVYMMARLDALFEELGIRA